MPKTIGFIGTGLMGRGMAANLIQKGHTVKIYNRTRAKAEEVAKLGGNASVADSPAQAAEGADVVITMVADPEALFEVIEGANGVLNTIQRDAVLIDSSTVSPPTTLRVMEALKKRGAHMLDAPRIRQQKRSGTRRARPDHRRRPRNRRARSGRPRLHGQDDLHRPQRHGRVHEARCKPHRRHHPRSIQRRHGLRHQGRHRSRSDASVIQSSRARAGIIDMKAPQVLQRDFNAFFPLKLMSKDMNLVLESAKSLGTNMPCVTALAGVYQQCLKDGLADEDFAATIKLLEKHAGVEVKSKALPM